MPFSGKLKAFAQDLAPDHALISSAKETINEISQAIQAHFKGRGVVDRVIPFGSLPKKTSIHNKMDIDVIVYINNQHPPFYDFIEELFELLPCKCQCRSKCDCGKNEFGIKFCFDDFKLDLLPAVNFLPSRPRHRYSKGQSVRVQHQRALDYVKTVPEDKRHYYSTSLSGVSVLFEKERDSFSHSLSRLAKYWSFKVPVDNIRSRSSIMEYMGAYAADRLNGNQDIVEGFRRFLQLFESSDSLKIFWTNFYRKEDVPKRKWTERPLLLDPCNPYNNFLDTKYNASKIAQMESYAQETLTRLNAAEMNYNAGMQVNFADIFDQDHVVLFPDENEVDCECCSMKRVCTWMKIFCLFVCLVVIIFCYNVFGK
ncbi:Inactive 2'-5' oligoadenylate synthetase 1C [Holothuria leucospilota]|uniref:Inactive 2'-5' oligoadenylate synthetase 1C n=1 Tax=Holothuria leucospilota TaxID=206669 RepID=A0A9Q0YLM9_HOLLE|nr:Inactive 2'-5' oligoadenylate synthetase 1C [Holothuria leucospilota]